MQCHLNGNKFSVRETITLKFASYLYIETIPCSHRLMIAQRLSIELTDLLNFSTTRFVSKKAFLPIRM